jgi:hypothetical protein
LISLPASFLFYLLYFELSKQELVKKQASMSKNQENGGTAKNLFARVPESTEHGATYTLHTTGLCNQQLKLYCGCGCKSDVKCLPVITACVLNNSKVRDRERNIG